jgi:predicted GNAT family N-acyltransferase
MITVRIAESHGDRMQCLAIRRVVFIAEQGVPEADEIDDLDDVCTHFLAVDDTGRALGTARLRIVDDKAKAQRVAVWRDARGRGVGRALMDALEREAHARGARSLVLAAQISAVPFYERLAYDAFGEVFDDAGIPHRQMRKALSAPS